MLPDKNDERSGDPFGDPSSAAVGLPVALNAGDGARREPAVFAFVLADRAEFAVTIRLFLIPMHSPFPRNEGFLSIRKSLTRSSAAFDSNRSSSLFASIEPITEE